jgi:hypothetical protein
MSASIIVGSIDTELTKTLASLQVNAENGLDSLRRAVDALNDRVNGMQHAGPVFNLALVEIRAKYIAAMKNIHSELQKLLGRVAESGASAESLHRGEIKTMQESLKRAAVPVPGLASPAAHMSRTTLRTPTGVPAMEVSTAVGDMAELAARPNIAVPLGAWAGGNPTTRRALQGAGLQTRARVSIPVGTSDDSAPEAITLEAVVVPKELDTAREILSLVTGHELFYIPQWNHFAARVGGLVFHANIAHIYSRLGDRRHGRSRARPEKVRECGRTHCGQRSCRYFHDPEKFPGSKDARNFTAESFIYAPPTMSPRGVGALRRFGSAGDLDIDLKLISSKEARLFVHQVSHDILCALILCKYVPGLKALR